MKFRASVAFTLFCLVAVFGTAVAQEVTRGSLVVVVQDPTRAVIPGATVKIVASVQREISGDTGARGEILFSNLIPDSYDVTVTSQGFKTTRAEAVGIRLGERRTITVTLEPGDIVQVVEVIGGAGGLDLSTTTTGGHVEDIIFQTTPLQRGLTSAFYLSPGVSDGGGTGTSNPSIGGASGFENLYLIDGVNVTDSGYGSFGAYTGTFGAIGQGTTTAFIKEVEVKSGGYEAKYGQALGGIVNIITKSGGNEFHGAVSGFYAPEQLEADRMQANRFRTQTFEVRERVGQTTYDAGFELSGAILQNRLFFFGALNPTVTRFADQAPQVFDIFDFGPGDCNAATNPSTPTAGCADLGTRSIRQTSTNYAFKFTGQLGQNHSVESSIFGDPSIRAFGPLRGLDGEADFVTGGGVDYSRLDVSNMSLAIRYNGVITPTWLINSHYGNNHNRFEEQQLRSEYGVTDFTVAGQTTSFGGAGFVRTKQVSDAKLFSIDNTNIIDAGFFGNHELTEGFYFETANFFGIRRRSGPDFPVVTDPLLVVAGDVGRPTFGGTFQLFSCQIETGTPDCFGKAPAQFQGASDTFIARQTRGNFVGSDFDTIGRYAAAYIQDNWRMNDYLTLKLGLRWEQEKLQGNTGVSYVYSNSWGPRIGAILDPFGTRKTKITFNFARFFQKLPNDLTVRAFSGERSYLNLHYWVDPSKNLIPDQAHYVGLEDCGGGALGYICLPGGGRDPAFSQPTFSGTDGVPPLPGTRMTYQDEFGVGIQQEVRDTGIIIGARVIDRRIKRLTEDTNAISIEQAAGGLFNIPFIIINPSSSADQFLNPRAVAIGSEPCFAGTEDVIGAGGTGFCFSADSGDPGSDGIPDGLPDAIREYTAVELTFERRMRDNWQFFANWRIARLRGNFEGAFRNDNGQADPGITSLFDFTDSPAMGDTYAVGALPNDRTHVINAYGSYMFNQGAANGLNIGMGIRVSSGKPLTELLAHPLFANSGEVACNSTVLSSTAIDGNPIFSAATVLAGCESSGRGGFGKTDTFGTVDFHVDYPVRISERFRLRGGVDVFNTFNGLRPRARRETKEVAAGVPDSDFNTPLRFQRPFNTRFSLRLEW